MLRYERSAARRLNQLDGRWVVAHGAAELVHPNSHWARPRMASMPRNVHSYEHITLHDAQKPTAQKASFEGCSTPLNDALG